MPTDAARSRCVMSDNARYSESVTMPQLFAHSEHEVKDEVRYLRRDSEQGDRYKVAMRLKINELRKAKGLTVEALAEAAGYSKSYMSELASGKKQFNARVLDSLARVFECNPLDLIDDTDLEDGILEHIKKLSQLSEEDQRAIFHHADALLSRKAMDE